MAWLQEGVFDFLPAMSLKRLPVSERRIAHRKARLELLARCVHKARLQGRASLTLPLTAPRFQGEQEVQLADMYASLATAG